MRKRILHIHFPLVTTLLLLLTTHFLWAGTETFNARLTGQEIVSGTSQVGIEDDKFQLILQGGTNFTQTAVTNLIALGVDHESSEAFTAFHLTFNLMVDYLDVGNNLQSFNTSLTIKNDPGGTIATNTDQHLYRFAGAHSINVQIIDVLDNANGGAMVALTNLPENLYLSAQIEVERYYLFNTATNATITHTANATTNELDLAWNHIEGAESYELEWTFINDYNYPSGFIAPNNLPVDFKNNSTRVSLNTNTYSIPLLFEHGYLIYRVRALGRDINDPTYTVYGNWSSPTQGLVNAYTDQYAVNNAHEVDKNWQYTVNFAEEGKRKEAISYFDGGLRNRQTVSKLNTDEQTIVGESIYDHQGRAAIQTLPVPTGEADIKYYEAFNLADGTTNSYSRDHFDIDQSNCDATTLGMDTDAGASSYYGPRVANDKNAYLPDAQKFPFTQIQYTPDNTGRIRSQGGVGADHQLETGRATDYFYGQPEERELQQLFGAEAGNVSHYKKNVVKDANGQLSVSYLDLQGRVVATAIAGDAPNTVEALPSDAGAAVNVNDDLLGKDFNGVSQNNNVNPEKEYLLFAKEKIVTTPGNYSFDYNITAPAFSDVCLNSGICFDCVYDLTIDVQDECGESMPGFPVSQTVGTVNPFNTNCDSPLFNYTSGPISVALDVGTYTISKRLTISNDALAYYKEQYASTSNNSCYIAEQTFIDNEVANVDISLCDIDCNTCINTLGTENNFIAAGGTALEYQAALEACEELCEEELSVCQSTYNMLLADVSPGGQYATFDVDASGNYVVDNNPYTLSLFVPFNRLPANFQNPQVPGGENIAYWKNPNPSYKNADGSEARITVTLNASMEWEPAIDIPTPFTAADGSRYVYPQQLTHLTDFITLWQDAWAEALVSYHPEYCYYEWCQQNEIVYGAATQSSEEFDQTLRSITTIADALTAYTDLNTLINQDPFFNDGGIGTTTPVGWTNTPFQRMQAIINNYPNGLVGEPSIAIAAAMAHSKCGNYFESSLNTLILCILGEFGSFNTPDLIATDETWNTFKELYLSIKKRIQEDMLTHYALYECAYGGYNGCIGQTEAEYFQSTAQEMFRVSPIGSFVIPFSQPTQACNAILFDLYSDKVKRFIGRNDMAGIINRNPQEVNLEALENQVDYDLFHQTGQTPLARDFEGLLTALAQANQLTGNNVALENFPQFTPDLYRQMNAAIIPAPTDFIPYNWNTQILNGGATLSVDIANAGQTNFCTDDLVLDFAPGTFNFNNLGTTFSINKFKELHYTQTLGGAYCFNIVAEIDNDLNSTTNALIDINLTGTTCHAIDQHTFDEVCTNTGIAESVMFLMRALLENDVNNNSVPDLFDADLSLEQTYPTATFSYSDLFAPIKELLITPEYPSNNDWHWHYDGGLYFEIYDQVPPNFTSSAIAGPRKFFVAFHNFPSSLDNITDLLDISPDPINNMNNWFELSTNVGGSTTPLSFNGGLFTTRCSRYPSDVYYNEFLSTINLKPSVGVPRSCYNGVDVGYCGPPTPSECNTPEHQALEDMYAFLNEMANHGGFVPGTTIDLDTIGAYTSVLDRAVNTDGLFEVQWTDVTISNNTLTANIVGRNDVNLNFDTYCSFSFSWANDGVQTFQNITGFDYVQANGALLEDGKAYHFDALANVNIGGNIQPFFLRGNSCIALQNCVTYCEVNHTKPTTASAAQYSNYTSLLASFTEENPISSEQFLSNVSLNSYPAYETYINYCITNVSNFNTSSGYYYNVLDFEKYELATCVNDYISYLNYAATNWNFSRENETSPFYISLIDFCTYTNEVTAYQQYVNAAITENVPLNGLYTFGKYQLNICLSSYTSCLNGGLPACQETDLKTFCNGGISVMECIAPSDPVTFPVVAPNDPCSENLIDAATLNGERAYQNYLSDIIAELDSGYRSTCLTALENFTLAYEDKEHHYTLYYYDQAGNLVRTVPPQGVKKITDQADLDLIEENITTGNRTYFTEHEYLTTYEYNSLNQLVSQSVPDHNFIDDICVTPATIPSLTGLTTTAVQFTPEGTAYLFANNGSEGFIYQSDDNGLTWYKLSALGNQTLNGVHMFDPNNGYAVGEKGIVLKTTDGGLNWIKVPSFTTTNLNDVYFHNATHGVIVGDNGTAMATNDGGASFFSVSTGFLTGKNIVDLDFKDNNDGKGLIAVHDDNEPAVYQFEFDGTNWLFDFGPDYQVAKLNDLQLLTSNRWRAVGEDGMLLETTNQGGSWDVVNTYQTTSFDKVHFHNFNPELGCVIAEEQLLATTNGGDSYTNVMPTGITGVKDMYFVNANDGYALTTNNKILATNNAGGFWEELPHAPVHNASGNYNTLFFETLDIGYVVGENGNIAKTTTRGTTPWTDLSLSFSFANLTEVYFSGPYGVVIDGAGSTIYGTDDGGSSNLWTVSGLPAQIVDMAFTSPTAGYLITTNELYTAATTNYNSWAAVNSLPVSNLNAIAVNSTAGNDVVVAAGDNGQMHRVFIDATPTWLDRSNIDSPGLINGVATSETRSLAVGNDGKIYISQDEGDHWQLIPSYLSENLNAVDITNVIGETSAIGDNGTVLHFNGSTFVPVSVPSNSDMLSIDHGPSLNTAYAVGKQGTILNKQVFGAWVSSSASQQTTETLNQVDYNPNSTHRIAVGTNGKIFRFNETAFTCVTDVNTPVINDVQMIDANTGYAIGENGTVLKTVDGGISWSLLIATTAQQLNAIHFINAQEGFVVGVNGFVAHTTNGGSSWTNQNLTGSDFNAITFADALHGVIVGNGGAAYYTDDAGATWNAATTGALTAHLNAVYLVGSTGYFVGNAATAYKTTDYGVNWQALTVGVTADNLNDVYFQDLSTGWAIGDNGTIVKTKDGGATWFIGDNSGSSNYLSFHFNENGQAIIVGDNGGSSFPAYQLVDNSDRYTTRYWYDKLGRLIISQNSKQAMVNLTTLPHPRYSYTQYDALGRIVAVGEVAQSDKVATLLVNNQIDDNLYQSWINAGTKTQVTSTYYDNGIANYTISGFAPQHLRSRVASITFEQQYDGNPTTFDYGTHYSYDVHGNVATIIQDNPALAPMQQQYKRLNYAYDLVSGNVNKVSYQEGEKDQFYHRYHYDADNRITQVYTSNDGVIWDQDAKYDYYEHGPLARTELGDLKVQGMDHAYTIHGWLKGVNSNTLAARRDMGKDGHLGIHRNIPEDEYGYTLGYYDGDYKAINSVGINHFESDLTGSELLNNSNNLYNGNINHMVTGIRTFMQGGTAPHAMSYKYDQLNRLKEARSYNDANVVASNQWASSGTSSLNYGVNVNYDANGNIMQLTRNAQNGSTANYDGMDNLNYTYAAIDTRKTNRLAQVEDLTNHGNGGGDIPFGIHAYQYDKIGNLLKDVTEEIDSISWSVYGKVLAVTRTTNNHNKADLEFAYDGNGNRILKIVKPRTNGVISTEDQWVYTHYVRDASGNTMAIYEKTYEDLGSGNYRSIFQQKEVNLYGSNRLGTFNSDKMLTEAAFTATTNATTGAFENIATTSTTVAGCNGLLFDGSDDIVTIPYTNNLNFGTGEFTVEAWINPGTATGSYETILSSRSTPSFGAGILLIVQSPGNLLLQIGNNHVTMCGNVRDGNWHHVAVSRKDTIYAIYVDGQQCLSGFKDVVNLSGTNDFIIGAESFSPPGFFSGLMDEFRFWNVARSEQEIIANMHLPLHGNEPGLVGYYSMNEGSGDVVADLSSSNNNGYLGNSSGTKSSDPQWAMDGKVCQAIEGSFTRELGKKNYELSNHLGNVLATVSDRRVVESDSAQVLASSFEPDELAIFVDNGFASNLTTQYARTGMYSLRLMAPLNLVTTELIPVQPGDVITNVEAWLYSEVQQGTGGRVSRGIVDGNGVALFLDNQGTQPSFSSNGLGGFQFWQYANLDASNTNNAVVANQYFYANGTAANMNNIYLQVRLQSLSQNEIWFDDLVIELFRNNGLQQISMVDDQFNAGSLDGWQVCFSDGLSNNNGVLRIEHVTNIICAEKAVNLQAGKTYHVSVDITDLNAVVPVQMYEEPASSGFLITQITATGNINYSFTATNDINKIFIASNGVSNVGDYIEIDNFKITEEKTNFKFIAEVTSAQDYYPFGMIQPDRSWMSTNHRYLFNGKEFDNEWNSTPNVYDYGFRMYDARLGRFFSVDPVARDFPWYTPYAYAGNSPILNIDLDGLEEVNAIDKTFEKNQGKEIEQVVSKIKSVANTVTSQLERAFDIVYDNVLRDGALEGDSDPANIGTLTKQDVKVGTGVLGILTGAGAIVEGAAVLGIISIINGIDDAGTNIKGESLIVRNLEDESTKSKVNTLKTAASVTTLSSGLINTPISVISGVGVANDAVNISVDLFNNNSDNIEGTSESFNLYDKDYLIQDDIALPIDNTTTVKPIMLPPIPNQ